MSNSWHLELTLILITNAGKEQHESPPHVIARSRRVSSAIGSVRPSGQFGRTDSNGQPNPTFGRDPTDHGTIPTPSRFVFYGSSD